MNLTKRLHLAVVVVTFQPEPDVCHRLIRYSKFFGHVVVVDNTEPAAVLNELANVEHVSYVPLHENLGIAAALNIGIRRVRAMGFESVLLLDQDSQALPSCVASALRERGEDIAIVAMTPWRRKNNLPHGASASRQAVIDVPAAITSGSILAIRAFDECGGFDERLFIDYVDTEYCLRLRRNGWRIVRAPDAPLEHALGAPRQIHFLGWTGHYVSHAPFRSYYRVRNGLHVAWTYRFRFPVVAASILQVLAKELIKALFVEESRKSRLGYMLVGVRDWISGRFGSMQSAR